MTKIIADCCGNHRGDTEIIFSMIEQAENIGIDYIKFQAFYADRLNNPDEATYNRVKRNELSRDTIKNIIERCNKIKPLFTVIDTNTVDFLCSLGVTEFKIASSEVSKGWLLGHIKQKGKRIFISTGMSTNKEIKTLTDICDNAKFFYCISKYPTKYEDIDFDKMQLFDGFSDHTEGIEAAKIAVDNGMEYIERHFTLGKYLPGNDHKFSSTPDEFKELCDYRDYKTKIEQYKRRWTNEC